MLERTDERMDWKTKLNGLAIGGAASGLAGIPICLLEQVLFQWHFWISFTGYIVGVLVIIPVVLTFHCQKSGNPEAGQRFQEEPDRQLSQPRTYQLGEALLLSTHLMACKKHEGLWLCCEKRAFEFVHLFVLHEEDIQYLDNHLIGSWENYLEHYGETIKGWQPAERMLPESVLQRVKSHLGR